LNRGMDWVAGYCWGAGWVWTEPHSPVCCELLGFLGLACCTAVVHAHAGKHN
jgi:hypothetical protein